MSSQTTATRPLAHYGHVQVLISSNQTEDTTRFIVSHLQVWVLQIYENSSHAALIYHLHQYSCQ